MTQHKQANIYRMTKDELYEYCHKCGLSEEDCRIAYFFFFEKLKGKPLYEALGYSIRHIARKKKELLKLLTKN